MKRLLLVLMLTAQYGWCSYYGDCPSGYFRNGNHECVPIIIMNSDPDRTPLVPSLKEFNALKDRVKKIEDLLNTHHVLREGEYIPAPCGIKSLDDLAGGKGCLEWIEYNNSK